MTKFILDAMYYQIFIFNRDKFILENPHERTIQIICGILFLPVIVLTYLLIKENFNYKTPFVFFYHNLCFTIQDILFVLYQKEKRYGNYKE